MGREVLWYAKQRMLPSFARRRLHMSKPLAGIPFPRGVVCIYIGQRVHLYEVVAPRRDKSCGRVVEKFWLRTWLKYLRAWIFGLTCLVFKTTCIDRRKPLREDAFSFTRRTLFPPQDKRNARDKAKGLCISSERHIPQCWIGTRCRGQTAYRIIR